MSRFNWALFLAFFNLVFISATQADLTPQRKSELKHLLLQDCGSCHGMTLKGGLGRPLLAASMKLRSANDLKVIILEGIPGTAMPPWKPILKDEEAAELVRLIQSGEATP